jgi:hypothetical protein
MKRDKKKSCGKKIVLSLLKLMLIWCAAVSVYKTQEANAAAKRRREAREQSAQEWEFDRVYPGSLSDR